MDERSPLIARFHHASVVVNDLDEALQFYRDVLGCQPIPRPDLPFPGAWLRAGSTEVHLLAVERTPDMGAPPTAPNGLANHIAFAVEDLEQAVTQLRRAGYEPRASAFLPQVFVQDPSGNVVELTAAR